MVDKTISDLYTDNPITGLADGDLIEAEQSSTSGGTTFGDVFTYVQSKTFTAAKLQRYSETTAAATSAIDRADGGRQTLTLTADVTLTITMSNGEDMELTILNGDTWTVTWPAGDWLGGSLPVLGAKTRVIVDKDSAGTLNFSLVGDYS